MTEAVFSVDKFLADVDRVFKKLGRCVIAVSEGIHDEKGSPMAEVLAEKLGRQVERDPHGNVQLSGSGVLGDFLGDLIKNQLKIKRVRSDTFGYLQRSFPVLAVSRVNGQYFAFFAEGKDGSMVAHQRQLQLGDIVGNDYVVESGMKPGDKLITSGLQFLADGAPVTPKA